MNSDSQSGLDQPEHYGKTILVVNDDEDALFLFERSLRRNFPGAQLVTADNGKEGIAIWERQSVDAILTDNRMPHVTGIMLTRKIREADTQVPIVMMTCSIQDRDEAMRAGVTLFYTENDVEGAVQCLKQCLEAVKKSN